MKQNEGLFKENKYGTLYECMEDLIDKHLTENQELFNDFTVEENISILPFGRYYMGGKRIEREDVFKMYNNFLARNKK